jgi:hypothetical protein
MLCRVHLRAVDPRKEAAVEYGASVFQEKASAVEYHTFVSHLLWSMALSFLIFVTNSL